MSPSGERARIASMTQEDAEAIGLASARERHRPAEFRLSVAAFNARAIRVYERAGFARTRSFLHATNCGEFAFVEMERRA